MPEPGDERTSRVDPLRRLIVMNPTHRTLRRSRESQQPIRREVEVRDAETGMSLHRLRSDQAIPNQFQPLAQLEVSPEAVTSPATDARQSDSNNSLEAPPNPVMSSHSVVNCLESESQGPANPAVPKDEEEPADHGHGIVQEVQSILAELVQLALSSDIPEESYNIPHGPQSSNDEHLVCPQNSGETNLRQVSEASMELENEEAEGEMPPASYTETAFARHQPPFPFLENECVHEMLERARTLGINRIPVWQQPGIQAVDQVILSFEPFQEIMSRVNCTLHAPAFGTNPCHLQARLIFYFFYIGILVRSLVPNDDGPKFLHHLHAHVTRIYDLSQRSLEAAGKCWDRIERLFKKFRKEIERKIYPGILSLNYPLTKEEKPRLEDPDLEPDLSMLTLIVSSFGKSILLGCAECPEEGSRRVKDLSSLQAFCLVQILFEEVTKIVDRVGTDLLAGTRLLESGKDFKGAVKGLTKELGIMRKDFLLRPNNCSGVLSNALKRLRNCRADHAHALHSATRISKWTLNASQAIFEEAKGWAPAAHLQSPADRAPKRRSKWKGYGGRDRSPESSKTYDQLFESSVEGNNIIDALQILIQIHKDRKEFIFSPTKTTSEALIFDPESLASLASGTMSILQLRPGSEAAMTGPGTPS